MAGDRYDQGNCAIALKQIRETVEREGIDMVVGSSLGGFLTLLTMGIRRIVINPCYSPSQVLPKLEPHNGLPAPSAEMIATYAECEPMLKAFPEEERQLVTAYFAEEDELLGDTYQKAFLEEITGFQIIPGGHHVSEDAVKQICYLHNSEHIYM